jgi:ribonuclease P protein component
LCGKKGIERLLARGKHGNAGPMRYIYLSDNGQERSRILVSVPKKLFKRAVKRNLYKRRIRESWRRQKHMLDVAKGVDILIIYSSKELLSYEEIYSGIGLIIEKINRQLSKNKTDEQIPADS